MSASAIGDFESVRIDRLAAGGDGIGRLADGCTVFVALTAPGDVARVRVFERRKRFARAELVELETSSSLRIEPRCEVFGRCGGCDWQHLSYEAQIEAKGAVVRDAITRIARLELPSDFVFHASPQEYRYRSRARLLQQGGEIGFRRRGSHEMCSVRACPVLVPALEAKLGEAGLRTGEPELELAVGTVEPHSGAVAGCIEFEVAGDRLRISEGAFSQANALLLETLVESVMDAAGGGAAVCELYAGAGLFTLGLSRVFTDVLAIEVNPRATRDLAFNLERAGRTNVQVLTRAVDRALGHVRKAAPEVIVLDPPRSGLDAGAAAELASLGARRIVYLSCDPATLARDIKAMAEGGFALVSLAGFDLFPQTAHVEALAVLEARI